LSTRTVGKGKIRLRPLRIEDYDGMVECWSKSALPIRIKGRESKESIGKEMLFSGAFFVGAFDFAKAERLVGLAIGNYDGRRGWINRIAVLPEYREKGVASALLNRTEEFLRNSGAKVIAALISKSNRTSRNLFEEQGYSTDEEILYYTKRESPDA
jgi:ribosomal protein S18 acetylase RimI-like enzyme